MHPKDISLRFEKEELFFRWLLRFVGCGYIMAALVYLWMGVQPAMSQLTSPLLTSTLGTKVLLLAMLAFAAAGNIRHSRTSVYLLIAANAITGLITLILWLTGILQPPISNVWIPALVIPGMALGPISFSQIPLSESQVLDTARLLSGSVAYDVVVCIGAYFLQRNVEAIQYRFCKFLKPVEYDVVYALAEVLIHDGADGSNESLTPAEIANNVDQFLYKFPGKRTQMLSLAIRMMEYLPFLWRAATFSYMNPADRLNTIETHFVNLPIDVSSPKIIRKAMAVIARWLHGITARINGLLRHVQRFGNRFLKPLPPLRWVWLVVQLVLRFVMWVVTFAPNALRLWRHFIRGLILSVKQLVYTGYYNDKRTHVSIGYVPFSERPRAASAKSAQVAATTLDVIKGEDFNYQDWVAKQIPDPTAKNKPDNPVVIVGTGAAACVIAHYLVQQGWYVLMIERGPYVASSEFSENEVTGSSKLYSDGLLQISNNLELQVAQGRSVGGGTTVNNGICFAPPNEVIQTWQKQVGNALNLPQLNAAIAEVKCMLKVQPQNANLNPTGKMLVAGLKALLGDETEVPVVEANIQDCVGCGYCNTGCQYDRKKSMLISLLPEAQKTNRLSIVSECEVTHIYTRNTHSHKTVTDIECQLPNGGTIRFNGCAYIVSAGAIASSVLLKRSRLGGPRVGKGLSFNIGAVMTGRFSDKLNAYDGLQMSHTYSHRRGGEIEYMLEAWFNPPVTQAMRMPGWFEDHYKNMRQYDHMMSVGVLVGSAANNIVVDLEFPVSIGRVMSMLLHGESSFWALMSSALTGSNIVFKADKDDMKKVLDGLKLAGKAMLAIGANVVMPSTFHYMRFTDDAGLDAALDPSKIQAKDLHLASAHPQGGNALSVDASTGVVGADFRVHGVNNLFVCDASVFPTSVKVNPQLTIMGLARYAAKHHIAPILAGL